MARLREARALLAELLARPSNGDVRVRIAGLAAEGGLAYWMNDAPAARVAYEERLRLASTTDDNVLLADAHYDLGFLFMVAEEEATPPRARAACPRPLLAAGREDGAIRARQALVLAVFLAGEYETARELENENLGVFRRTGSQFQIADSMTLLSAVHWRLGDPATSWSRVCDALTFFASSDSASGLARALGMAAIILLADGDGELGARVAGATYRLVREKGVMLAPVKVLHLPDPAGLAVERLGAERSAELLSEGEAMSIEAVVALVLSMPSPAT